MSTESVAFHLRRAWRWSAVGVVPATVVPILLYVAHSSRWTIGVTAVGALVAWANLVVQTRILRSVLRSSAG